MNVAANPPVHTIGPMPWADGIVDVQDLILLSEYLFEDYRMIAPWKLDEIDGDIAYDEQQLRRLLLNENYPSWLYPVIHGATTIWEHLLQLRRIVQIRKNTRIDITNIAIYLVRCFIDESIEVIFRFSISNCYRTFFCCILLILYLY